MRKCRLWEPPKSSLCQYICMYVCMYVQYIYINTYTHIYRLVLTLARLFSASCLRALK